MRPLSPLLIAAIGIFLGSVMDAVVKDLSAHSAVISIAAWRYIFGTGLLVGLVWIRGATWPDARGVVIHSLRGVLQAVVAMSLFWALTQLALAEATAIGFTATIMIAPLAHLIIGEKATIANIVAALLGLAGVVLAVSIGADGAPMGGDRLLGALAAFLAAFCYALSNVLLRLRAGADDKYAIAFFANAVPALVLAPLLLVSGPAIPLADTPVYLLLGLLGVTLWLFLTIAYARAPAGQLAPLQYTALIWSALVGCFYFGEIPRLPFYAGAALVILACWIVIQEGRKPRAVATA